MEYHKKKSQTLDDLSQIWPHFYQPSSLRLLLEFQEASEEKKQAPVSKPANLRKPFHHACWSHEGLVTPSIYCR